MLLSRLSSEYSMSSDNYPVPPKEWFDEFGLPHQFGPFKDGKVTLKPVASANFDLTGYLLTCHLLVEHYIDEYLKAAYPKLDWDAANLTFGQQAVLLGDYMAERNLIPTIKHLNSLRNRVGHRVDYALTPDDMQPFLHCMERFRKATGKSLEPIETTDPKRILQIFTYICSAVFLGSVETWREIFGGP